MLAYLHSFVRYYKCNLLDFEPHGLKRFSRTNSIFQYIKNLRELEVKEERIHKHVEVYERLAFNKIHKTSLSFVNQKRLLKFYRKHKKNLDWSTITSAAGYFDFSSKKEVIKISFSAWLGYVYFSITGALLFLMVVAGLFLSIQDYGWQKQLALVGIIIVSFGTMIFLITKFIAPINMARKIRKHLASK